MTPHAAILIIDDDDRVVASLVDHLSGKGYPVFQATTSADELAEFERQRPDIVLLDQELPDGKGIDICRRLLDIDPTGSGVSSTSRQLGQIEPVWVRPMGQLEPLWWLPCFYHT